MATHRPIDLLERIAERVTARGRCACRYGHVCDPHRRATAVVLRYHRYCDATILTCPCGKKHSRRSWAGLDLIGEQSDEFERAELRNCGCHSTIYRVNWRAPCRVCGKRAWDLDEHGAICEPCFDSLGCAECGEESCDCSGMQLSAHEDHMVDMYMERD